jgi:hypothetical protein
MTLIKKTTSADISFESVVLDVAEINNNIPMPFTSKYTPRGDSGR